jgi:hypothetical protein
MADFCRVITLAHESLNELLRHAATDDALQTVFR